MNIASAEIRVRFAPSPTGYLHVGGLRTALYNYLFARKHGGTFILRIEDTDQSRFVKGAVEKLIDVLHRVGLAYDEGPVLKMHRELRITSQDEKGELKNYPDLLEVGEYGPYIQSERLNLYRGYAEQLVKDGKAYRCFCSAERLEEMRAEQLAEKRMPKYDRRCLLLSFDEVKAKLDAGEPHVIRMKVPDDREVSFEDLVRGKVSFHTKTIDDTVLLKSDGYPTYHLANVVDDHLMAITHVIRAEEWLPSTPKHLLLYEALSWDVPQFAHLPLLLNPDRSKLSKRQGDVAVEDYLAKGYLPEALVNFVALLGWNPGEGNTQEIFSLEELSKQFDLSQVNKAGAIFDLRKLDWMNEEYIKRLSLDELYERAMPFLASRIAHFEMRIKNEEEQRSFLKRVLTIEQERLTKLADVGEENPFFFREPNIDLSMLPWKGNSLEATKIALTNALSVLSGIDKRAWTREVIGEELLEAAGAKRGDFLWPLRVALSGTQKSPPPQDIAWVIGKEATIARVKKVVDLL